MNERSSYWQEELRIIPQVAIVLAVVAFGCIQVLFQAIIPRFAHTHELPPHPWWTVLGIVAGIVSALLVLMMGYVYRDAQRRGMSPILWTLVVLFFKALGIIAYLLVRKPLVQACPNCGAPIGSDYRFCPKCRQEFGMACAQCGRAISRDYACCPYCGKPVGAPATP